MNDASSTVWRAASAIRGVSAGIALLTALVVLGACGPRSDEAALDSDANGFVCLDCQSKFYTDRTVFPNHCPACQKPQVEMVVGFQCPADSQVTYGPRGRGFVACEKCGKVTNALIIPRLAQLKEWGAVHKSAADVGAQ